MEKGNKISVTKKANSGLSTLAINTSGQPTVCHQSGNVKLFMFPSL